MTDVLGHLVVDGNDVMEFKLVRSARDIENDETSFGPEMCHQVFGENENIFGYTDLQIKLYYSAGSLQTYLGISYSDKIDPKKSGGLKADDIEGELKKVLAPGYVTNLDQFISNLERDKTFTPYGKLLHSFNIESSDSGDKRTFEVYYCETSTPGFLDYHERLQTFLLWYIDAASFIDVDDDQWTFFTMFEKCKTSEGGTTYSTAAYATVFRYYAYPCHQRPRISQVLTLPPFRKLGLCAQLVQVIGAKVVTNARTPGSRCYGYVTMASPQDAENCIKNLHRTELHGRMISVEKAKSESESSSRRQASAVRPERRPSKERKEEPKENEESQESGEKSGEVKQKKDGDVSGAESTRSTSRTREKSHRSEKVSFVCYYLDGKN
ncbi:histone acetyltransferase type B catalytic subunit-like [Zerene cesonia]|uniref:histone acetyltransferase type B catalytic subunit-like n=1 Tax=Zerene cesonia TaxID=33412 RepID=UPI0018E55B8F|nr:histone acetyltransferase type B catalytic subunit-like [Zerene cesonia]